MAAGGELGTSTTIELPVEIAGYRLSGVLGEGGSGVVYEATSPQGLPIALKVLKPDQVTPRESARFLQEADVMRRVHHPSLIALVDAGPLPDGGAFIAMPRLRGQNLADRLQRGPLRFDRALALFEQIAGALGALHRAGLVHRDIKPENVFVEEGDARAILLDLGIARDLAAGPSTTTRAGMIRGTPAYMAPERFFGKPATPQTDVYELAVVLYITLVGALPWSAPDNPTERLRPRPPAASGVALPPRLETALMQALSSEPAKRPSSVDELVAAVIDALSPERIPIIVAQHTRGGANAAMAPPPHAAQVQSVSPPPNGSKGALVWVVAGLVVSGLGGLAVLGIVYARGLAPSSGEAPNDAATAPALDASSIPIVVAPIDASSQPPIEAPSAAIPTAARVPPRSERRSCRCLPKVATWHHGGNQALAPNASIKARCECRAPANLCLGPVNPCPKMRGSQCAVSFTSLCTKRFSSGETPGGACSGVGSSGATQSGKWDCSFDESLRVFAGRTGARCDGYRVTGDKTEGTLDCE